MPGILHGEQFVYSPGIPSDLEPLLLLEAKQLYAETRAGYMFQQYYADQHYTAWICDLQLDKQTELQISMPESSRALLMVLSGNATLHTQDQTLHLYEKNYCLLPQNHQARTLTVEAGSFRVVILLFNPLLTSLLGNAVDMSDIARKGTLGENCQQMILGILQNTDKGEIWRFKRQLLFLDLLFTSLEEINNAGRLERHHTLHRHFEKLEEVKHYIRNNMGKKLSVQMLADRFNMLPTQLRRSYKQVYKHHLADYIRTERLAKAKTLLHQTDMPVHAIAWEVGYESAAGFTRTFTLLFNQSPTDYRKSTRQSCN